jgi:preprotein translocase subunit SecA
MNILETMSRLMDDSKILGLYPSKSNKQESIDNARTTLKSELTKDNKRRNKQGRNEKCSCGSGLKYKKCCGRIINDN